MKFKKILATVMAMSMVMGMGVMAHAETTVWQSDGMAEVDVMLSSSAAQFSVSVPTSIRVNTDKDGYGTTKEHMISNYSSGAIEIDYVDVYEYSDNDEYGRSGWKYINGSGFADNLGYVDMYTFDLNEAGSVTGDVIQRDEYGYYCYDVEISPTTVPEVSDLCQLHYTFCWAY